jgi:nitroreductase
MDAREWVMTRRNIKQFRPDPVDRVQLLAWLEAASYAPNHRMTEPWEVLIIGPETRALLHHKTDFGGAPLVLAVLSTPAKTQIDRDEHYAAVACFLQNFMLLAHAHGVGTGWSSLGTSPKVRSLLGVGEGYEVVGLIPVGYPAEVPAPKARTPIEQKIRELP